MREGALRDWLMRGFAIALLVVIAATSYWYSHVIRKPGAAPRPIPGTPDFVVDRLILTQFDEAGRARYRLFAQQMFHYSENDDVLLASPRLVTLYPDRPQVEARSQRAHIENGGERVAMTGAVLLRRAGAPDTPELTISTEALTAWPDDDRYAADTRTEVERGQGDGRFRTASDRLVFDNIKGEVNFDGRVRTEIPARGR